MTHPEDCSAIIRELEARISAERARADRAEAERDEARRAQAPEAWEAALREQTKAMEQTARAEAAEMSARVQFSVAKAFRDEAEAAERDAASLRDRVGALAGLISDRAHQIGVTNDREIVARYVDDILTRVRDLYALSAPSSSPAATGSDARTFDEFCVKGGVTDAERADLVHHLAALRQRRTVERLAKPRLDRLSNPLEFLGAASPSPGESDATAANSSNEEG